MPKIQLLLAINDFLTAWKDIQIICFLACRTNGGWIRFIQNSKILVPARDFVPIKLDCMCILITLRYRLLERFENCTLK